MVFDKPVGVDMVVTTVGVAADIVNGVVVAEYLGRVLSKLTQNIAIFKMVG